MALDDRLARRDPHWAVPRRLASHLTWPLTLAELDSAISDVADRVSIVRPTWQQKASSTPLHVSWHPQIPGPIGSMHLGDVPAEVWLEPVARLDRAVVTGQLRVHALPDLTAWLQRAFAAPPTWQDARHERRWVTTPTGLQIVDDDGMHILDRDRGGRR